MGGIDAGERRPDRLGFEQISRDGSDAGDEPPRPAGDAMDLPARGEEMRGQIAPDQAGHSGDHGSLCHGFLL
jgi:hypothetical protein